MFAVAVGLTTTRILVSRGFACRPEEAGKDTRKGVLQDREAGADYAQVGLDQGPDAAWDKIVGDVLLVLDRAGNGGRAEDARDSDAGREIGQSFAPSQIWVWQGWKEQCSQSTQQKDARQHQFVTKLQLQLENLRQWKC